ncbi:MAG: twin-arginine translocase TatA/TatE family subunit, partial [Actinobacteria bacterium]|nr:twin-arginine translocase TatA/TatE family subunit [Actinomycetota bacterium]
MPNIGGWEIVIVVVLALIIFGPKKLPELGSSLGRSITGFKKGLRDAKEELQETEEPPATAEPSAPDGAQAQA